ncbi:hypothetical protein KGM_208245 [Danaus plexippus plexippus]|uniref:FLYWCH-type domain-containing protein n=1 Tax=Danaus plexippus plexippus TaxID=278856 RepID=A0A212FGW5_DANPL|nr:hypothetical protein KGM_208245 [Danaus plexippus plexippus]
MFVLSRNGNPVLQIGKNRYRKWTGRKEQRALWLCNKNNSGCTAKVLTVEGIVVQQPVFVLSRNGKPVIQLGRYRFNRWSGSRGAKARWICTKDHKGCRAKILTVDEVIVRFNNDHNH